MRNRSSRESSSGANRGNMLGVESTNESNATAIAILRIVVGLFFVVFGEYKVFGTEFTLQGGFSGGSEGFHLEWKRLSLHGAVSPNAPRTRGHTGSISSCVWRVCNRLVAGERRALAGRQRFRICPDDPLVALRRIPWRSLRVLGILGVLRKLDDLGLVFRGDDCGKAGRTLVFS